MGIQENKNTAKKWGKRKTKNEEKLIVSNNDVNSSSVRSYEIERKSGNMEHSLRCSG